MSGQGSWQVGRYGAGIVAESLLLNPQTGYRNTDRQTYTHTHRHGGQVYAGWE